MQDYRQMAIKYIYKNKRRAVLCVLGITMSVALLFVFLNSVETYLAGFRAQYAAFYPEKDLRESIYTIRLSAWFVAYLFTILGVGVVRNAIQLLLMEQIKDFGMLRCIGATKPQLKSYVYTIGFALEGVGILFGIATGFGIYSVLASRMKWDAGFYGIALALILIAFLGDMVFAMEDCCKVIKHMTPVDAVRGKYKIREEKIKVHGKSVWGILFGVEGDYAAKSLKRNPKRYWISVFSIGMGIAAVCLMVAFETMLEEYAVGAKGNWGTYQFGVVSFAAADTTAEDQLNHYVFREEQVALIEGQKNVKKAKPVHAARLHATDPRILEKHVEMDFRLACPGATWFYYYLPHLEEEGAMMQMATTVISQIDLFGYDEEDYGRLKKYLTEGTLQLSENGVILVGGTSVVVENEDTLNGRQTIMKMTDYQVGDTIEVLDYQRYAEKLQERLQEFAGEENLLEKIRAQYDCYQECLAEGLTRTYVIEGIIERDPNIAVEVDQNDRVDNFIRLILPLERFTLDTGLSEDYPCGTVFSMKGKSIGNLLDIVYASKPVSVDGLRIRYLNVLDEMGIFRYVILAFTGGVVFIVVMNLLNMLNITFSNMYLRRQELAQLRVLGMSENRLLYTVLLEGVIIAIGAALIGLLFGYLALYLVRRLINLIFFVELGFPWGVFFLMAICGLVLLCICIVVAVKSVKVTMAESLAGNE